MPATDQEIALRPTEYEREALREIREWMRPDRTWMGRFRTRVNELYNGAAEQLKRVPGFEWTVEHVIAGLLRLVNEITQDWVPFESIMAQYRAEGLDVTSPADIQRLDLSVVDNAVSGLMSRYRNLTAIEGAATGYVGAAGIPTDIVALVALNLRATGEMGTHYGFDLANESERYYALSLLDHVARPSTKARDVALSPMIRITNRLARQQAFEVMEQVALSKAVSRITRSLGIHLTRAKLAQIMPITGAVVGGGYNAYYTSRVCESAYQLYRRRFLIAKYGARAISELEDGLG